MKIINFIILFLGAIKSRFAKNCDINESCFVNPLLLHVSINIKSVFRNHKNAM